MRGSALVQEMGESAKVPLPAKFVEQIARTSSDIGLQDLAQIPGTRGFRSNLGMVPLKLGWLGGMPVVP